MMADLSRRTDDELLETMSFHEDRIRRSQERLAVHNAEWARRHTIGPCGKDCREPHGIAGTYAQ